MRYPPNPVPHTAGHMTWSAFAACRDRLRHKEAAVAPRENAAAPTPEEGSMAVESTTRTVEAVRADKVRGLHDELRDFVEQAQRLVRVAQRDRPGASLLVSEAERTTELLHVFLDQLEPRA